MKIGYRAGYRDGQKTGQEEGYAQCLQDMEEHGDRMFQLGFVQGSSASLKNVLGRMLAQENVSGLVTVMQEIEEAIEGTP